VQFEVLAIGTVKISCLSYDGVQSGGNLPTFRKITHCIHFQRALRYKVPANSYQTIRPHIPANIILFINCVFNSSVSFSNYTVLNFKTNG